MSSIRNEYSILEHRFSHIAMIREMLDFLWNLCEPIFHAYLSFETYDIFFSGNILSAILTFKYFVIISRSILNFRRLCDQDTIVSCVGKYRKSSFTASMNISNALKLNQFNSIHLSEFNTNSLKLTLLVLKYWIYLVFQNMSLILLLNYIAYQVSIQKQFLTQLN